MHDDDDMEEEENDEEGYGYGDFSGDDVDELLAQGVKIWDEDAADVLAYV